MKLWRWWWKKILGIVGPPRCSDAFAVVARVLEVCLVITRLGGVRDTKHVREHSNASSALEGRYKCWFEKEPIFWMLGGGSRSRFIEIWTSPLMLFVLLKEWSNKSKNEGLISADRRTKPTLMLTIPRSYKVVYNGFISSNVRNCDKIRCWGRSPTRMRVTSEEVNNIAFQHGFWLRGVQS